MSTRTDPSKVDVRKLRLEDDTGNFDCGNQALNEYIWYQAKEQQLENAAVVYVAWRGADLVGFVSLNMSSIRAEHVAEGDQPGGTPYPTFPALMIGRLATDTRFQRQGVGQLLCQRAVATAMRLADDVGCQFVILNAKPGSISFYEHIGFQLGANQPSSRLEPFMYFKIPTSALR